MTSRPRFLFVAVLAVCFTVLLALAGCSSAATQGADTQDAQQEASGQTTAENDETPSEGGEQLYTPEYKPTGDETAVFETTQGRIVVKLHGKDAPIHVGNFVELARKGFYNDTKFHRYIKGFVVQGGDPDTKSASAEEVSAEAAKGDGGGRFGIGGPGYTIKGEFDPAANPNKHIEGALGMARSASPDSAGSQFYFALSPLPQLDGGYTVFGQVTEGMDVMNKLRAGDVITSVSIDGATE